MFVISVHLADFYFEERNVLGKPMSRAIQNDIQNIQKMLDKDIEDSSLSGKILFLLSFSSSVPSLLAGNPVTPYLSELCISPSEMRFKFPHFYWVSIAPPPPCLPPHTLYLASASEFPLTIWNICFYHHRDNPCRLQRLRIIQIMEGICFAFPLHLFHHNEDQILCFKSPLCVMKIIM